MRFDASKPQCITLRCPECGRDDQFIGIDDIWTKMYVECDCTGYVNIDELIWKFEEEADE